MYGHVHMIAQFSPLKIQSKNKINSFKFNDVQMIFLKFQIYIFNTQAKKSTCYIADLVWKVCLIAAISDLIQNKK